MWQFHVQDTICRVTGLRGIRAVTRMTGHCSRGVGYTALGLLGEVGRRIDADDGKDRCRLGSSGFEGRQSHISRSMSI